MEIKYLIGLMLLTMCSVVDLVGSLTVCGGNKMAAIFAFSKCQCRGLG